MAKLPWKPWHEVVQLRDDLKSGELPLSHLTLPRAAPLMN
jgi:hypothetical protein